MFLLGARDKEITWIIFIWPSQVVVVVFNQDPG